MRHLLALLLALLPLPALAVGAMTLTATTETIEVQTSSSASTDYRCSYVDTTSTTVTPGSSSGNIASATTTTVISAPGASTTRKVSGCFIYNRSTTTSQNVIVKFDISGTERYLYEADIAPGESIQWREETGFAAFTSGGDLRTMAPSAITRSGVLNINLNKVGSGADATGYHYAFAKDAGSPAAYSLGTPGLNGYATDCSAITNTNPAGASQMGAPYLPNPSSGGWYLTQWAGTNSLAGAYFLIDVVWYNTGIAVTTLTEQAITTPTFPARDTTGASTGYGYNVALLTTTANTNAATIANTTVRYTDATLGGSQTATMSAVVGNQAPATPVIGTFLPLNLATGGSGVASVQGVTLATSYGGGALSLIVYRSIGVQYVGLANIGTSLMLPNAFTNNAIGTRVYNGSCLWAIQLSASSTASKNLFSQLFFANF